MKKNVQIWFQKCRNQFHKTDPAHMINIETKSECKNKKILLEESGPKASLHCLFPDYRDDGGDNFLGR